MLSSAVTGVVRFCTKFPWLIIVLGLCGAAGSTAYSVKHFAINTDINKLISPDLDWRKREFEFEKSFPGHYGSTLIVIDAPTTELSALASAALAQGVPGRQGSAGARVCLLGSQSLARGCEESRACPDGLLPTQ